METVKREGAGSLNHRLLVQWTLTEDEWINAHASGTLRKNKRPGFAYRKQYLEERIAYQFGFGFEIAPRSRVTTGVPITEGDCHAVTEAGWHIERYMTMQLFEADECEARYIRVDEDGSSREGIGIVITKTSVGWIPEGHTVFAIIAEYDPLKKEYKEAQNPA